MKRIALLISLFAWGPWSVAQTNVTDTVQTTNGQSMTTSELGEAGAMPDATNAPAPQVQFEETHIFSDRWEFGVKSRRAVYRGNVRLVDPRLQLTCEHLTADIPPEGERVDKVVAETNVVIVVVDEDGITNRGFADKAVYTYAVADGVTNEVVELSGEQEPRIEREDTILYGSVITWDRVSNQIVAEDERMIHRRRIEQPKTNSPSHTVADDLQGTEQRPEQPVPTNMDE